MEDFDYVVQLPQPGKICFGSGLPRDVLGRKGMNLFMMRYTPENYSNVSPGKYKVIDSFNAAQKKPCASSISKRGYSGLARFAKKVETTEEIPGYYNLSVNLGNVKKSKYPFNSSAKRKALFSSNKYPGPGSYSTYQKRCIDFEHSFGGKKKMQLGVELKCCEVNKDICSVCGEKPRGDYWHRQNEEFLCRSCMINERKQPTKYSKQALQAFRKIRDCSDIHSHENTRAKIYKVTPQTITKWMRLEAYLSLFNDD